MMQKAPHRRTASSGDVNSGPYAVVSIDACLCLNKCTHRVGAVVLRGGFQSVVHVYPSSQQETNDPRYELAAGNARSQRGRSQLQHIVLAPV